MIIGVFVPNYTAERMKSLLKEYPHVKFRFFVYEQLNEVSCFYERNIHFLDGVLFSDLLAHMLIKEKFGEITKPAAFLKLSGADFYQKLFYMILEHSNIDFSKIFIDFHAESKEVKGFIEQLPDDQRPYTIGEAEIYVTDDVYDRLLNVHRDLHDFGKVNWSLTRFVNITDSLEAKNIRYDYFEISDKTIHKTLFGLINEINLHYLKDNQVVYGQLALGQVQDNIKDIRLLNIHSLLLDFNKQTNHQLHVQESSLGFKIFTTYATLELMTNEFTSSSLLEYLAKFIDEPIHIGWGIGKTFIQAQSNAAKALDYSIHNKVSSTYVIENDESFIGPLVSPSSVEDATTEIHNQVLFDHLEAKVNMTQDHIHKILLAFKLLKSKQITSAEFADIIGITVRSANRILRRAEEEKLVYSTIDSTSGLQGRPRKLYELNDELLN